MVTRGLGRFQEMSEICSRICSVCQQKESDEQRFFEFDAAGYTAHQRFDDSAEHIVCEKCLEIANGLKYGMYGTALQSRAEKSIGGMQKIVRYMLQWHTMQECEFYWDRLWADYADSADPMMDSIDDRTMHLFMNGPPSGDNLPPDGCYFNCDLCAALCTTIENTWCYILGEYELNMCRECWSRAVCNRTPAELSDQSKMSRFFHAVWILFTSRDLQYHMVRNPVQVGLLTSFFVPVCRGQSIKGCTG
jgi:hypothetical protein